MEPMISLTVRLVASFFFPLLTADASYLHVHLPNGTVSGQHFSLSDRTGWEFLGIPFAEPPLGDLRFSRPQPLHRAWTKTLLATKPGDRCLSPRGEGYLDAHLPPRMVPGFSEDCLYLNVWTPENARSRPRAVMVWIHGGAFVWGEGYPYFNSRALAVLGDVVAVTIQYRLGVLGFLRLGEAVGGNWGLWDQQLALRWVKENIERFGGDSSRITIFGESAGAASVSLHLLNPESARLFSRAIVQSGTAVAHWVANPDTTAFTADHRRFAAHVGCSGEREADLVACLRGKDAAILINATSTFVGRTGSYLRWFPVVDSSFILEDTKRTLATGRMPRKEIMLGMNADEGEFVSSTRLGSNRRFKKADAYALFTPPLLYNFIEYMFRYYPNFPSTTSTTTINVIKHLITSGGSLNATRNRMQMNRVFGNSAFVCPANAMADAYASINASVYFYRFARRPSRSKFAPFSGATHADELQFVFGKFLLYPLIPKFYLTSEEQRLSLKMIADWAMFAKSGSPKSADWRPFSLRKREYYNLDLKSELRMNGIYREECSFWKNVLPLTEGVFGHKNVR